MEWIDVKTELPKKNQIVDLWDGHQRHTNYTLVMNFIEKGNNFFEPVQGGISVIRFDGSEYYTNATHWMPLPEPPKQLTKPTEK